MAIGREGVKDTLNLIDGEDFEYSFQWSADGVTPADYPAGVELYIEVADETWPFVIDGNTAYVRVESEVQQQIEAGTGFKLMMRFNNETPTREKTLAYGQTKRWAPR